MPGNIYDQFDAQAAPAAPAPKPSGPNPYDVFDPPEVKASTAPKDPTWQDRVQAHQAGFWRGLSYLAGAIPDAAANVYNIGKAGAGVAYHEITGKDIPDFLQNVTANPVGGAIAQGLDKFHNVTPTTVDRPDDAASRYISGATSLIPAIVAGGGTLPQQAKTFGAAIIPNAAGQAVGEAKPFESDAANNAASVLTTALTGAAMPRGRGPDVAGRADQNTTIRNAQSNGLVFPPATTNPTAANRFIESVAGKQKIQQEFQLKNQGGVNAMSRDAMNLPKATGPLTDAELATARAAAAPGYDAVRNAGYVRLDGAFRTAVADALNKQTGAARVVPSLKDASIEKIAGELAANKAITASDAIDTISSLRQEKSAAYAAGKSQNGAAYGQLASALEKAIDRSLTRRGNAGADMINAYRNSRKQFAIIDSIEDARNPATGNVQATQLLTQLKRGAPLSGQLDLIAKAAGQAPLAFKEPTHSTGVSNPGLLGALLGGGAIAHEVGGSWGAAPFVAAGALHGARAAAKAYAKGPLQKDAIPTERAPVSPDLIRALALSRTAALPQ